MMAQITADRSTGIRALLIITTVFFYGFFITPASALSVSERIQGQSEPPPPIGKVTDICEIIGRSREEGAQERLAELLKEGVDPNRLGENGQSPLNLAIRADASSQHRAPEIRSSRYDTVTLLVENKADIFLKSRDGMTPLHVAAEQNDINLVYSLLDKGADINALTTQSGNERSPLMLCFPWGVDTFNILLERGAMFDAGKLLMTIIYFSNEDFLASFLSRPVEIPDTFTARLDWEETHSPDPGRLRITQLIRQHMAAMAEAKKTGNPPKLLFKHQPPPPRQLVPPKTDPELITAVRNDDIGAVNALLDKGSDVNSISRAAKGGDDYKEGETYAATALHVALLKGFDDLAELLSDRGADVNIRNATGDTPLIIAARHSNLKLANKLIENGADVNKTNTTYNGGPLEYAKDIPMMNLLLAHGAEIGHLSRHGSVIHEHVLTKDRALISYLIKHGADINQLDREMQTPLHSVLQNDYKNDVDIAFVKFLVENGADLAVKNKQGFTPYDLAISKNRADIAKYLQSSGGTMGDETQVFGDALYRGDLDTLKKLLGNGYNPNRKKYVFAATRPSSEMLEKTPDMIRLLAQYGADLKTTDENDTTLLHIVTDPDLIDFLVSKGVDVNAVARSRTTPLHAMVERGKPAAVRALLKHKAFPNSHNEYGFTPLALALEGPVDQRPADGPPIDWEKDAPPYLEVIRLLVEAGADPADIPEDKTSKFRSFDDDAGYKTFRKRAMKIIEESKAPVARTPKAAAKRAVPAVPKKDTEMLFRMISERFINKNDVVKWQTGQDINQICNMPVMKAAQAVFQANPEFAPGFSSFLNQLRLRGHVGIQNIDGTDTFPNWQYHGYTLLHTAAYYHDASLVRELLTAGADPNLQDDLGNTPLHYAAQGYSLDVTNTISVLQMLLDSGAKVNTVNDRGDPPIFTTSFVIFKGSEPTPHLQILRFLIGHGADIHIKNNDNRTLADMLEFPKKSGQQYGQPAQQEQYNSFLADLAKHGVQETPAPHQKAENPPLLQAISAGNLEQAQELIAAGADVNQKGRGGLTALLLAAGGGNRNVGIARLLIEKGADPHARTTYTTLISVALTQTDSDQMVKLLLDHGVEPVPGDLFGIRRGLLNQKEKETLQLLLDQGIDPNTCDTNGVSPLYEVVSSGNVEAAELLVRNGARTDFCARDLTEAVLQTKKQEFIDLFNGAISLPTGKTVFPALADMWNTTASCRLRDAVNDMP